MKKLLVLFMLIVSIVCSTFAVPIATAETNSDTAKASNGTSYLDYIPPNMQGEVVMEENTGDMNWVPMNNDTLVPLTGGHWGKVIIYDVNGDGYLDFDICGNGIGEKGTWRFYGNPDAQNPESPNYMIMGERRKINDVYGIDGTPMMVYDNEGNYVKTNYCGQSYYYNDLNEWAIPLDMSNVFNPSYIDGEKIVYARTEEYPTNKLSSGNTYRLVDYDNDGLNDIVYTLNEWGSNDLSGLTEHGSFKVPKFDANGIWGDNNGDGVVDKADPDHDLNGDGIIDANDVYEDTNGDGVIDENDALCGDGDDDPIHAYVMYVKNVGSLYAPAFNNDPAPVQVWDYEVDAQGNKVKIEGTNRALDVRGNPSPVFFDFDKDGDLDLICGSFVGFINYYENIGTASEPIYVDGVQIKDKYGKNIMPDGYSAQLYNCDWNNDGFMDIIVWTDSGEWVLTLLENTGKFDENNVPIFNSFKNFLAPADKVNFGASFNAYSVDWDGDGDEDIIQGSSIGVISYMKNVTIEKALEKNPNLKVSDIDLSDPSWEVPVQLKTPDGKRFRCLAGYKGQPLEGSENLGSPQGPTESNTGYIQLSVADWDMDGTLDIVYLDVYGRVRYLKGIAGDPYHINYPQSIQVEWTNGQKKPAWYDYWQSEDPKELVTIWRTTPEVVDLPIDEDGDGIAETDGLMDLVLIDHEGYFAFYQRYRDRDGSLKLKEGKRIFKLSGSLWQPTSMKADHGKFPYRLVDWDGDGDLDILTDGTYLEGNVKFYENISDIAGEYNFVNKGDVHTRVIRLHEVTPTLCDWNKDGIPDLLCTAECGNLYYFINNIQTKI